MYLHMIVSAEPHNGDHGGQLESWPGDGMAREDSPMGRSGPQRGNYLGVSKGRWIMVVLRLYDTCTGLRMVGYISEPVTGAAFYNIGHTEVFPVLLLCVGFRQQIPRCVRIALIWLAHINRK
jgi:hypothetical protein